MLMVGGVHEVNTRCFRGESKIFESQRGTSANGLVIVVSP